MVTKKVYRSRKNCKFFNKCYDVYWRVILDGGCGLTPTGEFCSGVNCGSYQKKK